MTLSGRLHKPGWKMLGGIFLVALIMSAAWGVRSAARQMAFFRVRSVEVRGIRYLPPGEVLSRLKVDTLMSLWDDLEPLRERVRHHPQVSDVAITRRLPGTLVVTIQENQPVALIQGTAGFVPYDSAGHVLPIDPARTNLDLPIVATSDPVLLKLVGAIRYTVPRLFSRIEEVRRTGRDEILLTLSRSEPQRARVPGDTTSSNAGTVRVRIPLGLSVERLADIFPVENDLARRQVHVGELDLRYRDQVIARLQ
ncbi:MAG TPA: FtsQ-type POTRA domain-containing protein [Gemmatimonadaceae bacterium]|nr:FtsQ-type POTRA domain-containing protein [Gemmatimonadaceae bacterium]